MTTAQLLVSRIAAVVPDIDRALVAEHLRRLDNRYHASFSEQEVAAHLRGLARLTPGHPASVSVRPAGDGRAVCTVLAFDYPAEFSLITGVLAALGMDIVSGDVFTWGPPDDRTPPDLRRRRIVDRFVGEARGIPGWEEEAAERLAAVISLAEPGSAEALNRARRAVNEFAAAALARQRSGTAPVLYPVEIRMQPAAGGRLRMSVVSQDTPFFLFAFSTALSLQGVSIEQVTIRTSGGRIEDLFEFADASGRPLADAGQLDRIKLSVLLTKQFTMFLGGAPDPLAALERFEHLVQDILDRPGQGPWSELLADRRVLADLAHLLGASTFLWEDFVRLQYETLLPMLRAQEAGRPFSEPPETLAARLDAQVGGANRYGDAPPGANRYGDAPPGANRYGDAPPGASDEDAFADRLNEFKDREVFLYDLDHILTPGFDFLEFSRRLSALAELVVARAADRAASALAMRFGEPRTVAGLAVPFSILGLGKLGGAALGYASDIELVFVYADAGRTSGGRDGALDNAEWFDRLVRAVLRLVRTKREGIFHLDLRLRPHGQAGPLASSLGAFCAYYAPDGPAQAWERLALVRLRAVGGDPAFGRRIERLRDEMVYAASARPDIGSLRRLRERQIAEKSRPGALNAKFSPGALVDLEYAVQILQVEHGRQNPDLRTPRIHRALEALARAGVLEPGEADELADSYHFFRSLINGLRMLRGSAQDLFLPDAASDEFLHLARRMGYASGGAMDPDRSLRLDFATHTAAVRAFLERHFGRAAIPGAPVANVADLVLSDAVPPALAQEVLEQRGFADPARALVNLRAIGGGSERRSAFARLAVLACEVLSRMPDPDMALNNWERLLGALADPRAHLAGLLDQPTRLEIVLSLLATSQFLADDLVRDPGLLDLLGAPGALQASCRAGDIARELGERSTGIADRGAWLEELRRTRRRELLRIIVRDISLGVSTRRIAGEISELAEGIVEAALGRRTGGTDPSELPTGWCVLAFGKLGGHELNYSSDIDLMGLCAESDGIGSATRLLRALVADLTEHTALGSAYRVDLRLRPWGRSGELVATASSLLDYYERTAGLWELQALLKARPVAGDRAAGQGFLAAVRPLLARPRDRRAVVAGIDDLRSRAVRGLARTALGDQPPDLKSGPGGLRDVEFLVQGLQLLHAHRHPALASGGTLDALDSLGRAGILPAAAVERLADDYLFLRRIEHFLQVYEDRQVHRLPSDAAELRALSRRMLGSGATADRLLAELGDRLARIRAAYEAFRDGSLG